MTEGLVDSWVEVGREEPLYVGDRVKLYFGCIGLSWITAAEIAIIESRVEGNEHFKIIRESQPSGGKFWFECEVTKTNPLPILAGLLIDAILVAGVFYLVSMGAEKLLKAPAVAVTEMVKTLEGKGLIWAGIALVALYIFKALKK